VSKSALAAGALKSSVGALISGIGMMEVDYKLAPGLNDDESAGKKIRAARRKSN
jgi:hypothetical protein